MAAAPATAAVAVAAVLSPTSAADVPLSPSELKDNGELPSPASAAAEDTLVHVDMTTLATILVDQQPAWTLRMNAMKRMMVLTDALDKSSTDAEQFVHEMARHSLLLPAQLSDRRSAIVKQACTTISTISHVCRTIVNASATNVALQDSYSKWILALLDGLVAPILNSIATINEPASACHQTLCTHWASLDTARSDTLVIRRVMIASEHKHAAVRTQCYQSQSILISKLTIAGAAENIASTSGTIYEGIEHTIEVGMADSVESVRNAARLAFIRFQPISPLRTERMLAKMSSPARKMLQQLSIDMAAASASNIVAAAQPATTSVADDDDDDTAAASPSSSSSSASGGTPKKGSSLSLRRPRGGKVAAGTGGLLSRGKKGVEASFKASRAAAAKKTPPLTSGVDDVVVISTHPKWPKPVPFKPATPFNDNEVFIPPPPPKRAVLSTPTNWGADLSAEDRYRVRTAVIPAIDKLLDTDGQLLTQTTLQLLAPDGVMNALMAYVSRVPSSQALYRYIDDMTDDVPLPLQPLYDGEIVVTDSIATRTSISISSTDSGTPSSPPPSYDSKREEPIKRETESREVAPFSPTDAIDIKRSSRVAQLLTDSNSVALVEVIKRRLQPIICHALAVFDPRSRGNIYHACAILAKMIKLLPSATVDIVLSPRIRPLFHRVFDYLHEPPVNEVLLSLLTSPAEFPTSRIDDLLSLVATSGLWHRVVQRCVDRREPELTSAHAATFVEGCIQRAQQNSRLATLLINDMDRKDDESKATASTPSIITTPTNDLLSQLFTVVCSTAVTRVWQLHQCSRLLTTLITSCGDNTVVEHDPNAGQAGPLMAALSHATRVTNQLYRLKPIVAKHVIVQVADIAGLLCGFTRGDPSPASPTHTDDIKVGTFTGARLAVLHLLLCAASIETDEGHTGVAAIPYAAWRILCQWCFLLPNNSMYLRSFTDLFVRLLRVATLETPSSFDDTRTAINTITWILADTVSTPATGVTSTGRPSLSTKAGSGLRFVHRLIDVYTNEKRVSSLHSYILQLCSHLRLTHDLLPSYHPLYQLLDDTPTWKSFLPLLRERTKQQARGICNALAVRPAILRNGAGVASVYTPNTTRQEPIPGISLRSDFARSLGYNDDDMRHSGSNTDDIPEDEDELAAASTAAPAVQPLPPPPPPVRTTTNLLIPTTSDAATNTSDTTDASTSASTTTSSSASSSSSSSSDAATNTDAEPAAAAVEDEPAAPAAVVVEAPRVTFRARPPRWSTSSTDESAALAAAAQAAAPPS